MKYESDREAEADSLEGEPSLTEMTEAAIKMLSKGSNGFLLVVEGGKIDKSHHSAKVTCIFKLNRLMQRTLMNMVFYLLGSKSNA